MSDAAADWPLSPPISSEAPPQPVRTTSAVARSPEALFHSRQTISRLGTIPARRRVHHGPHHAPAPQGDVSGSRRTKMLLAALGIFGASLFLGDGMITPAISVLSAVEGVEVAAPSLEHLVVPIASAIIVGAVHAAAPGDGDRRAPVRADHVRLVHRHRRVRHQRHRIAPGDPRGAARRRTRSTSSSATSRPRSSRSRRSSSRSRARRRCTPTWGTSAARRSRRDWLLLVFPACTLSYMGQGALILENPKNISNPFFLLVAGLGAVAAGVPGDGRRGDRLAGGGDGRILRRAPGDAARLPAAAADRAHLREGDRADLRAGDQLAAAGVGAHARADVQELGRARLRVRHRRSPATITITDAAVPLRGRRQWNVPLLARDRSAAARSCPIEVLFLAANLTKIGHGAWLPLLIGARRVHGHDDVAARARRSSRSAASTRRGRCATFIDELHARELPVERVPGTAVFLNRTKVTTPLAMRDDRRAPARAAASTS